MASESGMRRQIVRKLGFSTQKSQSIGGFAAFFGLLLPTTTTISFRWTWSRVTVLCSTSIALFPFELYSLVHKLTTSWDAYVMVISVSQTWKCHIIKFAQQFVYRITMSKQLFFGSVTHSQTFCIPTEWEFQSIQPTCFISFSWRKKQSLLIVHWPFCLLTPFFQTNRRKRWNFLSNHLISFSVVAQQKIACCSNSRLIFTRILSCWFKLKVMQYCKIFRWKFVRWAMGAKSLHDFGHKSIREEGHKIVGSMHCITPFIEFISCDFSICAWFKRSWARTASTKQIFLHDFHRQPSFASSKRKYHIWFRIDPVRGSVKQERTKILPHGW